MTASIAEVHYSSDSDHSDRVIPLSLRFPAWGCRRLSDHLKREGVSIAPHLVREILARNAMGARQERLAKLEQLHASRAIALCPRQARQIEKANPCFRERHTESRAPGEIVVQDSLFVGRDATIGNVYLHSVIDTYGSLAFACVSATRGPEDTVGLLREGVLPFYAGRGLPVAAICTDGGREFCGTMTHRYEAFVSAHGIVHRRPDGPIPKPNGYAERFNRTIIFEFFSLRAQTPCADIGELQAALNAWLHHYNYRRPHSGYRNYGRRPIEMFDGNLKATAAD